MEADNTILSIGTHDEVDNLESFFTGGVSDDAMEDLTKTACKFGSFSVLNRCLQWYRARSITLNPGAFPITCWYVAAQAGQIKVLQWLRLHRICIPDYRELAIDALIGGDEAFRYILSFEDNSATELQSLNPGRYFARAIEQDRTKYTYCLQWLKENEAASVADELADLSLKEEPIKDDKYYW